MRNGKLKSLFVFIIYLMVFIACENTNDPIKYDPDAERVAGKYIATTFWEPGSHGGGVYILKEGGKLEINLKVTKKMEGFLLIPDSINSDYPPYNGAFVGDFTLNEDTLRFENTNTFLDNRRNFFRFDDSTIVTLVNQDPFGIFLEFRRQ